MQLPTGEHPHRIRAALLAHIADRFSGRTLAPDAAELTAWTAGLSTLHLVSCLDASARTMAGSLADAVDATGAGVRPAEAIRDVVDAEFPTRPAHVRERLAALVGAVCRIAREQDGTVLFADLHREGFGSWEIGNLMADARRVQAIVAGEAAGTPQAELDAFARLRRAGERITKRPAPAAA